MGLCGSAVLLFPASGLRSVQSREPGARRRIGIFAVLFCPWAASLMSGLRWASNCPRLPEAFCYGVIIVDLLLYV